MSVFGRYSRYYDLLYRDKDYQGETDFVHGVLTRHVRAGGNLLELGCGTGRHAALLAGKGYAVHGVDRSTEMLKAAQQRAAQMPKLASPPVFSQGDVRDLRLGKTFDAVVALFHVASYQTANDDLLAMFTTAATHLKPGGVFFFDYWYGPAVLTDRPAPRHKHMQSDEIEVERRATPQLDAVRSVVEVHYHVTIRDRATGIADELRETHSMRYLFTPEIELLAKLSGLRAVESFEWMSGRPLDFTTWNGCSVLTKP